MHGSAQVFRLPLEAIYNCVPIPRPLKPAVARVLNGSYFSFKTDDIVGTIKISSYTIDLSRI